VSQILTREYLESLDAQDQLAPFRDAFQLPGSGQYFNGNSLGPRPKSTREAMKQVMEAHWGCHGGASWYGQDWMQRPARVGGKIAHLIGAAADEIIIADSTSINLAKMVMTALDIQAGRHVIVTEEGNFPTDLYILKDIAARVSGVEIRIVATEDLADALDDGCALLALTHVNYKTSRQHDMAALTKKAHEVGALALWDLSHSAGAVHVDLNASQADFAVGCTYKFLNGGPGAPAYLFVAKRHQNGAPALPGWMGHAAPFDFSPNFIPAEGMTRHLTGTPPILALAALECGVDLMVEAGVGAVVEKSARLGDVTIELVEQKLSDTDIEVLSPRHTAQRGAQICLKTVQASALVGRLENRGLIVDFRPPNIIRLGLAALYVRYQDIWDVVDALGEEYKALRRVEQA